MLLSCVQIARQTTWDKGYSTCLGCVWCRRKGKVSLTDLSERIASPGDPAHLDSLRKHDIGRVGHREAVSTSGDEVTGRQGWQSAGAQ